MQKLEDEKELIKIKSNENTVVNKIIKLFGHAYFTGKGSTENLSSPKVTTFEARQIHFMTPH